MNKINISKLDELIYEETLDNGLKIFVCKTPNFNKKLAFFQTRYGSLDNEFIPIKGNKMKKYPLGIAHFLEHKVFESKENIDYFKLFQENGAYLNAATSYDKTYYFFSCSDNFYDNLINLIDMVQTPYFTDENVEKEKGIIGQEIDMYSNDPNQVLYDKLYYNAFVNDPMKYDIAGTKKDIKQITKEDLYECYNTFYHPSNMFLTIVGDVDVEKTIELIKQNQNNKKYDKPKEIVKNEINEPKEVLKKEEQIYHNVYATKVGYAYKIILDKSNEEDDIKRIFYIKTFLKTIFGSLSGFTEDLIKEKVVKSYFEYYPNISDNYFLITFAADALNEEELKRRIDEKLSCFDNLEEGFRLYKKSALANYVKAFESPDAICSFIKNNYNKYKKVITNYYEIYNELDFDDYVNYIKKIDFTSQTKVIVKKKEKE